MIETSEAGKPFSPWRKSNKRFWPGLISAILAAVFLYFALNGLDWAKFAQTVRLVAYPYLILAFPLASFSYVLRALRWRVLLTARKAIPLRTVFWANMAGYLGNAFLPARMGEVIRSYFLGRQEENFIPYVFATALTERAIDLVVLVTGAAVAMQYLPGIAPEFSTAIETMALIAAAGISLFLLAPSAGSWMQKLINRFPIPGRMRAGICSMLESFLAGLASLRSFRRFQSFLVYTLFIWFLDSAGAMIFALVIHRSLSLPQAFLLLAGLGISSAIPSTPSYIGVYQFIAIMILVPFHFPREDALAYILLLQGLGILTVSFWGLIGVWRLNKKTPGP